VNFGELVCTVAKLRFASGAQIGVRASPIAIEASDAEQLIAASRSILGPSAFVAIACPGVTPIEEERLCLAAGERAAERATFWRNHIDTEAGERILYVSARRLGRAGGLQDTLFDLSERQLREGFVEWCGDPASGCPTELAAALRASHVAERADSRALARFAAAVFAAEDPLAAAGLELPLLSLARDSSFADDPKGRLAANVRWVRAASAGESRSASKLSERAKRVKSELAELALSSTVDLTAAFASVDLGPLSSAELESDVPKPRARKKAKLPKALAAAASAPTDEAPARAEDGAGAPQEPGLEPEPSSDEPAEDPEGAAPRSLDTAAPESAPAPTAKPASGPTRRPTRDVESAPELPLRERPARASSPPPRQEPRPRRPSPGPMAPAAEIAPEPSAPREEETAQAPAEVSPRGERVGERAPARKRPTAPPEGPTAVVEAAVRPDKRPPPAPAAPAPWTADIHAAELGRPAPLPEGVRALLLRSLQDGPRELRWIVRGEDPSRVFVKLPRGLGEPVAARAAPAELRTQLDAWTNARAGLLESLGGAERAVDSVSLFPYTALGAADVAERARGACQAAEDLLANASKLGADALRWALDLDTVTVASVVGRASVALSPLHPLVLSQHLQKLPEAAAAARADGPLRTVLAARLERALHAPSAWPGDGETVLVPSSPATGVIGFGSSRRILTWDDVGSVSAAVVSRLLEITPHAALGLRIAIDAEDPDAAVEGVASAVQAAGLSGRVWLHVGKHVIASELLSSLISEGRMTLLPPPTAEERPHLVLRVRHGEPALSQADAGSPPYVEAVAAALGREVGQVRLGAGAVTLSNVSGSPSSEDAGWEAIIAPRLVGPPRRGSSALMREARPGAELAVLTRDLRAAARELEPSLQQLGLADMRPKTVRSLVTALAAGSAGVLALAGPNERQLAAQLLEHALFERLGDDAAVAMIAGEDARRWLRAEVTEEWGTFGLGASRRAGKLLVCLCYGAIVGALHPEVLTARLARAAELVTALKDQGARTPSFDLLADLLQRGTRRVEDAGPGPLEVGRDSVELEISYLCLVPKEHPWSAGARLGGSAIESQVVGVHLLERVAMAAGRRRY
jgi:hypothetical protein